MHIFNDDTSSVTLNFFSSECTLQGPNPSSREGPQTSYTSSRVWFTFESSSRG